MQAYTLFNPPPNSFELQAKQFRHSRTSAGARNKCQNSLFLTSLFNSLYFMCIYLFIFESEIKLMRYLPARLDSFFYLLLLHSSIPMQGFHFPQLPFLFYNSSHSYRHLFHFELTLFFCYCCF